jgi:hypothetical protein
VELTTVTPVTVMPFPETETGAPFVVFVKFVPVRVTDAVVPRDAEVGLIDDKVATPGAVTVKLTVLLVPAGVVTDTVLVSRRIDAPAGIVKVAVTVVLFTTAILLTVIGLEVPETVIAVVPVRLLPVRITGTDVPRQPEVGEIELKFGPPPVTVNDTPLLAVPLALVTVTL